MRVESFITAAAVSLAALFSLFSCNPADRLAADGITEELAAFRKAAYQDPVYTLSFDIPESKDSCVAASGSISITLDRRCDIILDFNETPDHIHSVQLNGSECKYQIINNHIVINKSNTSKGVNTVGIDFTAGELSLNRRDEFLYTLLVPARAHTLFPCFDQPDMKAEFNLSLSVPEDWKAISNTTVSSCETAGGRALYTFAPTEPLSTYLFAFVAGRFTSVSKTWGGRSITFYHRETDPAKAAQSGELLDMVSSAIDYMEEYTGMDYPFAKYDFIAIPDFQYGGMEHTGATLYNDKRLFLNESPTTEELLGRASLIAHETAHMWFGDCVTMRWFDDVWTKEVFANWFAAQMSRPSFPEINHTLDDLASLYAPSYSEDRTAGSNAIRRPLDNLSNAGLIYCNIIYDKAPVAMEMLASRMGREKFKNGISEYLKTYAYGNASWDDLVAILGKYADFDIEGWSRVWIKEKGMPIYTSEVDGCTVTVSQEDPFGAGNIWPQDIVYTFVGADGSETRTVTFDSSDTALVTLPFEPLWCIPDTDGKAYGCFCIDTDTAEYIFRNWADLEETSRMSLLMTLYENVWRGRLDTDTFLLRMAPLLQSEGNSLIISSLLDYAASCMTMGCSDGTRKAFCSALRSIADDNAADTEKRLLCFRTLYRMMDDPDSDEEIYRIWAAKDPYPGLVLGETDYTAMSYQLMVRFPDRASQIRDTQLSRIDNPDRKQTFAFVSQAAAASQEDRDAFFESLLDVRNRAVESRALSALSLLNHFLRENESVKYITPGLEILPEIQRTGDIFFPSSWCASLLGTHWSEEGINEISSYVSSHRDIGELLMTKVLQEAPVRRDR